MSGQSGLFDYPERTRFGRPIPKTRILAAGRPGRRVRDQLTREVAQIRWSHKLAPETLNLKSSKAVPEIQVISLTLKPAGVADVLPVDVLRCIDRAIHFPLIFELFDDGEGSASSPRIRIAAAYKRPSEADAGKWVIGEYFASAWLPGNADRAPLPVALDLPRLYEQMLRQLIPVPAREGESLSALVERHGRITVLKRECRRLEARIQRERQFNRKVGLNQQLRSLNEELSALGI